MCGIFGYAGSTRNASEAVLEGLRKLDYRGYDSWGIGVVNDSRLHVEKKAGLVGDAIFLPQSTVGIGHTRWATHGSVTKKNAHPHYSTDKSFVLAQNGIVENAHEIKAALQKRKYKFETETDTEIIVRLIEEKLLSCTSLEAAVRKAFAELGGRNTIIVLTSDGTIIAARNGSPLVLGVDDVSGDTYLSSDVFSFAAHVSKVLVLDNGQMVVTDGKTFSVSNIATGKKAKPVFEKNLLRDVTTSKGSHKHYMLKEIYEAPYVIRQVVASADTEYKKLARGIRNARNVYCIGSGTAGGAAAQTAFYLRSYAGVIAKDLIGAEANEYTSLVGKGDLVIAPSQSGETADVLEVLEKADKRGASIASYVNMPGSMMTRMSDFKFMANAGPEICVMSTKVYVSQVAWGYLIAKAAQGKLAEGKRNLRSLATSMEKYLADANKVEAIKKIAYKYARKEHLFLLGKGQNLQIIKEGMVKIIEGAYIHAHAIPAGDLKHYAITLMEEGVPVIVTVSNDDVKADVLNAVHQVKARGAAVLGIANENHESFAQYLHVPDTNETSAIMNILPLQLLAYHMADRLKHNVDKPRNIAKSVTVK